MRHTATFMLLASLVGAGGAQAHASLDHAEPRVGNTVSAAPSAVTLWFTQNIEPAFTSIAVFNAVGVRVDTGGTRVDSAASLAQVGLRPLPPGVYRVRWRALSVDTHKTEGSFTFEVRP
ncbi:copper resistance CopC family protein [Methylocystis hirsuta]|uniref:Copper resistance protein CopC n=1 Tax=Methylocystis hirsuta TaxID=369798 RepID=A0A3M9XM46_9HYPH|nr:copper resistance CopC family protein [Methylocystis hirsuta]RNJ48148.1 copper resistance protein CopC [Methylocystis hirsuta]